MRNRITINEAKIEKSKPCLMENESLIFETREGMIVTLLIGIFFTFIPPFFWGPIIIAFSIYLEKNSGVKVTDKRLIIFQKGFLPQKYFVYEIPLSQISNAKKVTVFKNFVWDFGMNIINRLFRISDIDIEFDSVDGKQVFCISDIKKSKELLKILREIK
jgi:hypothetical protein